MSTASILMHSLGWALIHSIWQGAILYTLLRILLFLMPGLAAKVKYHLSFMTLAALFAWFAGSFYQEWHRLQAITIKVTEGAADASGQKVFFIKSFPQQTSYVPDTVLLQVERYFPVLIALYVAGVLLLSIRFVVNLFQINRLRRRGVVPAPGYLMAMLQGLRERLNIEKKVQLLLTETVNVPVMFGALKPIILLPVASLNQLTTDQLEAILVHELAHVKRNDYLLNILQCVVETILFISPFTWLISAMARREREHCCDDLVIEHTQQPLPYAKALATLEAHRISQGTLAMAATGPNNQLLNRIKRMMEMKKSSLNNSQLIVAFVMTATIAISIAWLTPAFAQNRKGDKEKEKTEKAAPVATRTTERVIVIDKNGKRTEYTNTDELPEKLKETIQQSKETAAAGVKTAEEALELAEATVQGIDPIIITKEVTRAMNEVDWEEINEEVESAMKEVDWTRINAEVDKAMKQAGKQLDDPKVRREVQRALENARAQGMAARAEAPLAIAEAREAVAAARREMAAARAESASEGEDRKTTKRKIVTVVAPQALPGQGRAYAAPVTGYSYSYSNSGEYDRMLKEMEKEGLLNRRDGFTVKKSGKRLYINGQAQTAKVYSKYRGYLKGNHVVIKGDGEDLTIKIRN